MFSGNGCPARGRGGTPTPWTRLHIELARAAARGGVGARPFPSEMRASCWDSMDERLCGGARCCSTGDPASTESACWRAGEAVRSLWATAPPFLAPPRPSAERSTKEDGSREQRGQVVVCTGCEDDAHSAVLELVRTVSEQRQPRGPRPSREGSPEDARVEGRRCGGTTGSPNNGGYDLRDRTPLTASDSDKLLASPSERLQLACITNSCGTTRRVPW
mmetsp:Transcript_9200/g.18817  ORF Transcript_9200/g.18817 Transcript_9200/m.18817 type:complete len:218 (+) Transcript_9200:629-1282(+)